MICLAVLNDFNGCFAARLWPVWRIDLWLCIICPKNYLRTVWIKKINLDC